jgi:hypothetical protein
VRCRGGDGTCPGDLVDDRRALILVRMADAGHGRPVIRSFRSIPPSAIVSRAPGRGASFARQLIGISWLVDVFRFLLYSGLLSRFRSYSAPGRRPCLIIFYIVLPYFISYRAIFRPGRHHPPSSSPRRPFQRLAAEMRRLELAIVLRQVELEELARATQGSAKRPSPKPPPPVSPERLMLTDARAVSLWIADLRQNPPSDPTRHIVLPRRLSPKCSKWCQSLRLHGRGSRYRISWRLPKFSPFSIVGATLFSQFASSYSIYLFSFYLGDEKKLWGNFGDWQQLWRLH